MEFETIILKKEGGIATVVLNRPNNLNAMNAKMVEDFELAAKEIMKDTEIRAVVMTGAGRAFSAGGDIALKEIRTGELEPGPDVFKTGAQHQAAAGFLPPPWYKPISLITEELPVPTIGMINGVASGAGFSLALHCDIRIGCPNSQFLLGYPGLGLSPTSEPWFLPRIVGLGRALEIILTNDPFNGDEAYRIGLLNKFVPNEDLEKETTALANKLARRSAIVNRISKKLVYKSLVVDSEAEMIMATAAQYISVCSPDGKEGVRALAEKRPPSFRMK